MISEPGTYFLTSNEYHADPASRPSLSSTLARILLDRSPLHAWTASRLNPDFEPVERPTFDIGRAAHRVLLGAGGDYAAIPEEMLAANGSKSTKAAKEFIADCRAAGVTPIKAEDAAMLETMANIARAKLARMRIALDPDRSEVAAFAEIDGVWCRAMIDNAPADASLPLIDFKTTTDASPEACIRAVTAYGYDVQAAHYVDTWAAATGERRRFQFIFQEKAPPFDVSVIELHDCESDDADWMLDARHKCAEARRIWGECLRTNHWPGYPPMVAVVGAPTWHRQRWADRTPIAPVPTRETIARATAWQAPNGDAA